MLPFSKYSHPRIPKNTFNTLKNLFANEEYESCIFKDLRLAIVTACITTENTESIMCPSNPDLLTLTGIAFQIHQKGGETIKKECLKVLKERGKLEVGTSVSTTAGQLPCSQVLHCVGPQVFIQGATAEKQLRSAIQGALLLCEVHSNTSVSIPLMYYGNMTAFSKEQSAKIIFKAVIDYFIQREITIIKHVRFTNLDKVVSEILAKILRDFNKQYIQIVANNKFVDNYYFFKQDKKNDTEMPTCNVGTDLPTTTRNKPLI